MNKLLSIAILGLLATGVTISLPASSHAQKNFSIRFGYGQGGYHGRDNFNFGLRYGSGYPHYGFKKRGFGSHHHHHHGFGHRPVIVQPRYHHWTPGRGCHTHGNIIVPHRGHFHVYPY